MAGDRRRTFLSHMKTRASSLINSVILADCHKHRFISVYMKTQTCVNKNKGVACKVPNRLALLIKLEHALSMRIFIPFTDIYILEVRQRKSLILIRKAFFLDDSVKIYMIIFFKYEF